ncbi:esterase/lipase family protein [Stieleria varia]|uniref:esterase/lipase family protein n=1 Tax=Stieleria varia TaxID=2528005 RepID=UPI0011B50EFE|nr:alpha/beta fold hydrolase [Stieleria varia]
MAGYFECVKLVWPQIVAESSDPGSATNQKAKQLYDSALGKLVESAIRFERFDPIRGVLISGRASDQRWLPVRYQGFPWEPQDFAVMDVVGECRLTGDAPIQQQSGMGVPLLVRSARTLPFEIPDPVFSATAVVHPVFTGRAEEFILDLINPLMIRELSIQVEPPSQLEIASYWRSVPIAFNLSAPYAFLETTKGEHGVERLLRPAKHDATEFGLRMAEPFQTGKIPVIFIHGLASSETAWHPMLNEIRTHPDLVAKFQFWTFVYRTSLTFPEAAAVLRAELAKLRNHYDPLRRDRSLDQTVLVGHSMGGLLAKLQVTTSTNQIENAIFTDGLEQVELPAEVKAKVKSMVTFQPSEEVARVIFIGTPHQGSRLADGSLGQVASRLAKLPQDALSDSEQILQNSVGIRNPAYKRIPKSVDLLRSDDPVLAAVFRLPVADGVHLHSIIGTGHKTLIKREPTDGVVPVSSARHPGTDTELLIDANHYLHTHIETINEVIRILRLHRDDEVVRDQPPRCEPLHKRSDC